MEQIKQYVLGVDGCRAGWIVCCYEFGLHRLQFRVLRRFEEILLAYGNALKIGVDMPIGLRDDGQPRSCDIEARRLLAPRCTSRVFPAPFRALLDAKSHIEACDRSQSRFGKRVSLAAFGILRKVAEVDAAMCLGHQARVIEIHPEVSFARMNGGPILARKKSEEGYNKRRLLLNAALGVSIPERANWRMICSEPLVGVAADDLLDSIVAAHTAHVVLTGQGKRVPDKSEWDERGLRMEITY